MIEIERPKIECVELTEDYGKFVVEPLERGFGTTLGNSLRRVLLSSLPGVVEDVTEIVLNLKKVKFKHNGKEPRLLSLRVHKQGVVTAADIADDTV